MPPGFRENHEFLAGHYSLILQHQFTDMKFDMVYVGIGAGICTAISMLPQLIRIIKKRKAEEISFVMLFILLTGIGGWIWYGILKKDYPIIITNAFSFVVNLLIILFTKKYKDKNA